MEILRWRASEQGDRIAYTFLADGEVESAQLTYLELDTRARAIAAALLSGGAGGARALLLYPPGLDFVTAFLGCLYAGTVAVPAYPPASKRHLPRLRSIAGDAQVRFALAASAVPRIQAAASRLDELSGVRWLATDTVDDRRANDWRRPAQTDASVAFLQYTSGSTAEPKGVMVSHSNLMNNQEAIRRAFAQSPESVIVGWLPLYHDMGLVGNLLQPLYLGARCILMPPVAFLQKPVRWLRAIARYRGTTSGGPNFAYDLCVRKVAPGDRSELDLGSWSVAFSGAEPVRAETIDRFTEFFSSSGFRRQAFYPCYGMAETTLMVTGGDPRQSPIVETVSASALEQDRIAAPVGDEAERRLVGCGGPGWGFEIRIVDPAGKLCAADRVGEIWVRGASVAGGYWNRPEATARNFQAHLDSGIGPFLRTGDLGFLRSGELFVTGRLKDLIIIRGRNHYPQDLELTAERSHPSLRRGCGAAVAADVDGEERLVIIYEIERHPRDELEIITDAIRRAVAEEHQVQVYEVVLLRTGTIPKTSSGKIQRRACLAGWHSGSLAIVGRSLIPNVGEVIGAELEISSEALLALDSAERELHLLDFLADRFARLVHVPSSKLAPDRSLTSLGLDSMSAVELKEAVSTHLAVSVSLGTLLEGATLRDLAAEILQQLAAPLGREGPIALADSTGGETGSGTVHEHPLSHGQRALWYLHRLDRESAAYNISGAARIIGALDVAALRRSLDNVARRHTSLRTTFGTRDDEPFAEVSSEPEVGFQLEEASSWTSQELTRRVRSEAHRPFDLERGPLLRVALFRLQENKAVMVLSVHHIVADLGSLAILIRELVAFYGAETGGAAATPLLEPVPATYADFALWQRQVLEGPEGERLWRYWEQQLAGDLPLLDVPTDRPRPQLQTFRGASCVRWLSKKQSDDLKALSRRVGATLYMTLLAAFQTLLYHRSGQKDLLVGSPMTVRDFERGPASPFSSVIGYFVNPVVLRADLARADATFVCFLEQVRRTALAAFAHRDYPFALLVERLDPPRDPGRSPLFQAMFVWQKDRVPEGAGLEGFALGQAGARLTMGGADDRVLTLESVALERRSAQFDLTLTMADVQGRLVAVLEHNADLFDRTTAARMLENLAALLAGIATDPRRSLTGLPLLSGPERQQLLVEWNDRPLVSDPSGDAWCLHRQVEAQATRTPDAVALEAAGRRFTYRDLDRAADRLARHLRQLGVGPEVPVGVCTQRCVEMVIGLLGILKAGGAYVPLDPEYPRERLVFTLHNSQLSVVLIHQQTPENLADPPARVVDLADFGVPGQARDAQADAATTPPPVSDVRPDNLAYLIYTSGSTGRPKGVAITHRSAATLVRWSTEVFTAGDLAGVLASTSICFDLSVFELFVPLSRGGRVVLAANALELPRLGDAGVTLLNTVPSAMAELAGRLPRSVHTVNLAGEPLGRSLVERIYEQDSVRAVYNLYGPSEDTTYSTFARIPNDSATPTIGRPVAATRAYLVDRHLQPGPSGAVGELLLGGAGLARGYFARPALTAERFVPDPFGRHPGQRIYRTGDLARYRRDGELVFRGRLDHQVKVRGFRIELGEIETALYRHPDIREAVVLTREEPRADRPIGDLLLVAYVVAIGDAPRLPDLRAFLSERLPVFMVPQTFVFLEALPLTPNGKIDRGALSRAALPPPGERTLESTSAVVAPATEVEKILARIWCEVLELESVGIYDNFFELGGHSLRATRVLSRVQETFQVELPVAALLESPTIAGLEEAVARQLMSEADDEEVAQILAEIS